MDKGRGPLTSLSVAAREAVAPAAAHMPLVQAPKTCEEGGGEPRGFTLIG